LGRPLHRDRPRHGGHAVLFDEPKPGKIRPDDVARAVLHAIEAPDTVAVREIFLMPTD